MFEIIYSFRGLISNLIGISVWAGIVFGTSWSKWASIPGGFVLACIAALMWGYIVGAMRERSIN